MGHREFTGGMLGATKPPTLVKSQGNLSLLSYIKPQGTVYAIITDYGEPTMEKVYPTEANPSKNGSGFSADSMEVFAEFDRMVAVYTGVVSDASGVQTKAGSHEELDEMLLASAELPEDIVVELQRRGTTARGSPKKILSLQYSTNIISKILGPRNDALRLARIHYESYPKEQRIAALRDLRARVAANYLSAELISSMLMSDRVKRNAYLESVRRGSAPTIPLSEYLNSQPTVAAVPLVAFRVRFVDQNGNEISGLPYEASVRGVLNFKEAFQRTEGGAKPGNFSSGEMLTEVGMSDVESQDTTSGATVADWSGRYLDPNNHYHLLYPYRARSRGGTPRGTVKVSITTPRNTSSTADWGNDRLRVYKDVADASEQRGDETSQASPKMLLYSHNFRFDDGGDPERITITVPVFVEPLPMHLIESPKGSGNIVSVWSIADDIGAIPTHQKTTVQFTVLRPKASEKWAEADRILPDDRAGYNDQFLQYEEFTSPQGRAAYREAEREASPVRGIRFALVPDSNNTWQSAKTPVFMQPDGFGVMTAELVPGRYALKLLIEINADGTTGLVRVASSRDPAYALSTRYDQLDENLQAVVRAKYPNLEMKRWTRFAPEQVDLGTLECPAAFYYRKTSEDDTTPVGIVGVKLLKSGSIKDAGSSRFRNFELKSRVPPLPPGKEPETGSIYELLGVEYPSIDDGWPGATTETDERIFDHTTILLSPDSSIDLSMLSAYEQRYEAERDNTGKVSPRLQVPAVGSRVAYMGYWIEHAWFDSAVGPHLLNRELAMGGGVHRYNMGKLETPFYDEGVLRALVYYPQSGVMRRKIVTKAANTNRLDPNLSSAITAYPRYNPQQATMDRVFHFEVEAGPEGAILSGRWCPLEIIGMGNLDSLDNGITETVFEAILEEIRRGGGPLRNYTGTQSAMPKWNQFWTTTADGWMFGGNDPAPGGSGDVAISPETNPGLDIVGGGMTQLPSTGTGTPGGALVTIGGQQMPGSAIVTVGMGSTKPTFENSQNADGEILHAPQPTYNDDHDEDFGFIGGA